MLTAAGNICTKFELSVHSLVIIPLANDRRLRHVSLVNLTFVFLMALSRHCVPLRGATLRLYSQNSWPSIDEI